MKHILTALLLAPLAAIYAADTPVAPQKPSPARNWADQPLLPQFSVTQAHSEHRLRSGRERTDG